MSSFEDSLKREMMRRAAKRHEEKIRRQDREAQAKKDKAAQLREEEKADAFKKECEPKIVPMLESVNEILLNKRGELQTWSVAEGGKYMVHISLTWDRETYLDDFRYETTAKLITIKVETTPPIGKGECVLYCHDYLTNMKLKTTGIFKKEERWVQDRYVSFSTPNWKKLVESAISKRLKALGEIE